MDVEYNWMYSMLSRCQIISIEQIPESFGISSISNMKKLKR
jgi:hypothetical protein